MLMPGKAAGRTVRCSACLKPFGVPWVREAIHDLAMDWLCPEDEESNGQEDSWSDVKFDDVESPMRP